MATDGISSRSADLCRAQVDPDAHIRHLFTLDAGGYQCCFGGLAPGAAFLATGRRVVEKVVQTPAQHRVDAVLKLRIRHEFEGFKKIKNFLNLGLLQMLSSLSCMSSLVFVNHSVRIQQRENKFRIKKAKKKQIKR